jgi:hypothetical protein
MVVNMSNLTDNIDDLKKEYDIENIISFNEFNIQEKLQKNSYEIMKFHDLYLKAEAELNALKEIKDKKIGLLYNKLRFEDERSLTKTEIEKYYIPSNEEIIAINKLILKQTSRMDFFEMCYKTLEKMSWNMKNYLDSCKVHL